MTPDEVTNLARCLPDSKPPGFGRTLIARIPEGAEARALMEQIRRAWMVIARWGRWMDEALGEWSTTADYLRKLPAWLQEAMKSDPNFGIENWMEDLHDREWVWWSGIALDQLLKIDLSADSMPISTWTIEFVIEKSGAAIVYRGDWLPSGEWPGQGDGVPRNG